MAVNKDGLQPGKAVSFEDMMRIENERRKAAKSAKPDSDKPKSVEEPKVRRRKKPAADISPSEEEKA